MTDPKPTKPKPRLEPCSTCRYAVDYKNDQRRCHLNPPQMKLPYDTMSAWPVVPATGGGCRSHEEQP